MAGNENVVLTEAVYYILLSLIKPNHGYGIMKNIEEISNGRVKMAPGTLYGAINVLQEKRWIELLKEDKFSRKKEYIITKEGKEVLLREIERLRELLKNGESLILEG